MCAEMRATGYTGYAATSAFERSTLRASHKPPQWHIQLRRLTHMDRAALGRTPGTNSIGPYRTKDITELQEQSSSPEGARFQTSCTPRVGVVSAAASSCESDIAAPLPTAHCSDQRAPSCCKSGPHRECVLGPSTRSSCIAHTSSQTHRGRGGMRHGMHSFSAESCPYRHRRQHELHSGSSSPGTLASCRLALAVGIDRAAASSHVAASRRSSVTAHRFIPKGIHWVQIQFLSGVAL